MVITSLGHKLDLVVGRRSALSDSDAVWDHTVSHCVTLCGATPQCGGTSSHHKQFNVNVIVIHCQRALIAMFDHTNVDAHYLCACCNVHLCV